MKTFFPFIFLSLFTGSISAQSWLDGVVRDRETGAPVSFANIGISSSQRGTVSDLDGAYRLRIDDWQDSLSVFTIGYESRRILANDLKADGEILLQPKVYELAGVEVRAGAWSERVRLGAYSDERGHSVGFAGAQLGTGMAVSIPIERETYLQSAHFMVNHAKGDSLLFRVNIYDFSEGEVGESLLPENVIIRGPQERNSVLTTDLSAFNLVVDHDVLLALEWVRDDDGAGNAGLTFRTARSRPTHIYTKYTSIGDYQQLRIPGRGRYTLCFYLEGQQ
jgi:hypothetical protein